MFYPRPDVQPRRRGGYPPQVEFADVIIMNKVELLSPDQRGALRAALRRLNREARVLESTYSAVDLSEILNTGLFSMAKAATAPGWLADLQARPRVL